MRAKYILLFWCLFLGLFCWQCSPVDTTCTNDDDCLSGEKCLGVRCAPDPCGNNQVESGEECDGTNLNNQTCKAKGFDDGTLKCTKDCKLDLTGCTKGTQCGNNQVEGDEECDGTELNRWTCELKGFTGGQMGCTNDCKLDTSACLKCGNGTMEQGEECDGKDLNNQTCQSKGFAGGELRCSNDCKVDTSACLTCGNGKIDTGEECDGSNIGNQTCRSKGFVGGTLGCSSSCQFDTSACQTCGNGTIDAGEECDGSNVGNQTCQSKGFSGGTLLCTTSCKFNTSACTRCGNGQIEAGEECDGTNFGTLSCKSLGFDSGSLRCSSACKLAKSDCKTTTTKPFGGLCSTGPDCTSNICIWRSKGEPGYCTLVCSSDASCPGSPAGAKCEIPVSGGQKVCGWKCSSTSDCPSGLRCVAFPGLGKLCLACSPKTEACNNVDDDCDGSVDENWSSQLGKSCTVGVGICKRTGKYVCKKDGSGVECNGTPGPKKSETCNGLDDDCDGQVDENWSSQLGKSCTVGKGICKRTGRYVCSGSSVKCSVSPGSAKSETCNGADDDCDGSTDEGASCSRGYSCGSGRCNRCSQPGDTPFAVNCHLKCVCGLSCKALSCYKPPIGPRICAKIGCR